MDERAKPKVSVIIPAYNAEKTIEQTLRSAMRQTYPNLEIIVVNDGSTDRTAWVAEQVACGDERVIILGQENSGVAAARNRGIAHSSGEFIAPLDADDIWHPTKTERQLGIFEQAANSVGLVYCYLRHIDDQNKITYSPAPICWRGDVYAFLLQTNFVGGGSSPLIRRSCIEDPAWYDSTLRARGGEGAEDFKLYLKIATKYEFEFVPEYLLGYRQSVDSMSNNVSSMARSVELVLEDVSCFGPNVPEYVLNWAKGDWYRWFGLTLLNQGDLSLAVRFLGLAIRHDPRSAARIVRALLIHTSRTLSYKAGIAAQLRSLRRIMSAPPHVPLAEQDFMEADTTVAGVEPNRLIGKRQHGLAGIRVIDQHCLGSSGARPQMQTGRL